MCLGLELSSRQEEEKNIKEIRICVNLIEDVQVVAKYLRIQLLIIFLYIIIIIFAQSSP